MRHVDPHHEDEPADEPDLLAEAERALERDRERPGRERAREERVFRGCGDHREREP